jgi:hypothetical protein
VLTHRVVRFASALPDCAVRQYALSGKSFPEVRMMHALLEIAGNDGSNRTVPCNAVLSAPSVSVAVDDPVVLDAGVCYSIRLLRDDGTPVGANPLRTEDALLRPVHLSAVELLLAADVEPARRHRRSA